MKYKANGETWEVVLSEEPARAGIRPLIFRCESNTSFGWRIVEVRGEDYPEDSVDQLTKADLDSLFQRSQPFDYSHDPKAQEESSDRPQGT